jgi:predicted double-glycine peptidase
MSQRKALRRSKLNNAKPEEIVIEDDNKEDSKSDIEDLKNDPNYGEKPEIQNENAAKKTLS